MNKLISLVALSLLLQTSTASAKDHPPTWQLGLFGGAYKPAISSDQAQKDHYELFYGADAYLFDDAPVMIGFESTWYLWNKFGLAGIHTKMGVWAVKGQARRCLSGDASEPGTNYINCDPNDPATLTNTEKGSTTTQLQVLPLQVGLVYRATYLHDRWGIPLEAYVKGGLDYFFWWATTGGQEASRPAIGDDEKKNGSGGTAGYHLGLGLSFNLDWLEPQTAARGRATRGLAGSYLFFEANSLVVAGFDEPSRLDLSATQYSMGIAIDFQ